MENFVEALNKKTQRITAVIKSEDGLYNYLTGEKLSDNWVEINLQVELAIIGIAYSTIYN